MFLLFLMVIINMPVSSILAGCPDLCICRWSAGKESVSCTNTKFKRIPQNIDGGTQLLNLTDNNISVLKNEEFNRLGLVNLQKIYLAKCRLQTIEVNAFKNLINLVELDLSFNKLTSVPSDSFQSISELRELKLSGNPIQAIFQLAFSKVPQLYRLEMTECRVANIDPLAFISLEEKLEWLKLDSNNLTNVNAAVFSNLRNLHGLELANNPWNCSCSLRDLREWMHKKNVPYDIPPVCHYPERLKEKSWKILTLNDFACSPKIFANANKMRGTEGKNVTLSCNIEGIPIPHVKWSIRGRIVANLTSSNKKLFLINQNNNRSSELLIHNADLQDAGIYTCTAENKAGKMDDSITLTITKKLPENFSTKTLIVSILLGVTLTFLCCLLTVCFVTVRKKDILKWRSSECRREDNYEKIELKPKCHRNLNGDVANNKEDGNLLVTISKKNGDYSVVPSGTDTDHEAEEDEENVEVTTTTSTTTGQIKEKVWRSDEISSVNQEHSSRDNINKIYNLTCGTYNNEPISISTSALTLENNFQSIYASCTAYSNNRQIIPDVIGHSTRSENSSTNDINEIFCTLPRNKRDNSRYRSTDSQCALLQESCNNSSSESFSRRFSMEQQQKNSQSKRNYSNNHNNNKFQTTGSMLNLQKDNLNSTPLLLDVRGLESRFTPFQQQQQQQSLLSSTTTSNPYDYHAAQLEKFLEEYRVLQKQLTKMKETCDSICQEQMKDLSTIVAGTSNCNQGNSVSLTTPNSNCIQDSVDFKNFENELTKYLMARSSTSHKNLPSSSSSCLPE